jgi:hypothetical protein
VNGETYCSFFRGHLTYFAIEKLSCLLLVSEVYRVGVWWACIQVACGFRPLIPEYQTLRGDSTINR